LDDFKRVSSDAKCAVLDIIAAPGQPRQSDPNLCENYWKTRIEYKRDELGLPVEEDMKMALSNLPRVSFIYFTRNNVDPRSH
jgi:hypothetical protein